MKKPKIKLKCPYCGETIYKSYRGGLLIMVSSYGDDTLHHHNCRWEGVSYYAD